MISYQGEIILVDSEADAETAVSILKTARVIGFDTETKPSFKRGQTNNVALLQLSTDNSCFLFRLNHIGLSDNVKALLEDESILKIGVSIHDDFHNLNKLYHLSPAGFIDLQHFVKDYGIADNSLAKIFAIIFGYRISKGQRLSNWEAEELTPHQQAYAALDAQACERIYHHLISGNFKAEQSQYFREIEQPQKNTAKPTKEADTDIHKKEPESQL
ncbi:MAG: 3'-5' exonuclease domain-containing protein 2 [Muribaculaceae bacterium]|nr:3'-5' exonuclease domain-containing protein 2 [Muribaculaceae bacterium]